MKHRHNLLMLLLLALILQACKRELIIVPDNEAPDYSLVPRVKIENYVQRAYIDLLGRAPIDLELQREADLLQAAQLSKTSRENLVTKLQTDTSYVEGDSSYTRAYHQKIYDYAKLRCIEGASDAEINQKIGIYEHAITIDSLNADWVSYNRHTRELEKLTNVLYSRAKLQRGDIGVHNMFAYMINNDIYDLINMNTFNFVNASFDNLLWRYPTAAEFQQGFQMVEYNTPSILFGLTGSNKEDYVAIMENSTALHEGIIVWAYQSLLGRAPTTAETYGQLQAFYLSKDFQKIQRDIMSTDEYAGF